MSAQPPAPPSIDLVHPVWADLVAALHTNPWLTTVLLGLVLAVVVRLGRALAHHGPRDAVRHLDPVSAAVVLDRAGGRCETHGPLGRCVADAGLRAVHVHPWSRGGQTDVANARAACPEHARTRVPTTRQLRRLAAHRAAYFPAGADPVVRRYATPRCAPRTARATVGG